MEKKYEDREMLLSFIINTTGMTRRGYRGSVILKPKNRLVLEGKFLMGINRFPR